MKTMTNCMSHYDIRAIYIERTALASESAPPAPAPQIRQLVMTSEKSASLAELNARSREIFRAIVDAYMQSGEPVGSRTLSRRLTQQLSPATIRNVMSDLQ